MAVTLAILPTAWAATGDQSPGPAAFSPIGPVAKLNPASPTPQQGIIVLRGGQVLHGKITRVGDRYHVVMPHGEILVRAVEVEFFCRTLDEAYRLKRSLLQVSNVHGDNVHGHLALADWCLRNKLFDAVATELSDAMAADPQNPMVAHFERRLQAALHPPTLHKKTVAAMRPIPSRNELDQLSRAMPTGAMETFTATIQPLLLNRCSVHECHGPRAASKFRLLRTHPGRAPSRRLTQRNLHSVMQWIDHENPAASPLLTLPIESHGAKRTTIFDETNVEQYRELVNWVCRVVVDQKVQCLQRPATVGHKPGSQGKDVLAKQNGIQQTSHNTPWPASAKPSATATGVKRAVFEIPLPQGKDTKNNTPAAASTQPKTDAKQKPAQQDIVDPFDPAIFNRRYLPDE